MFANSAIAVKGALKITVESGNIARSLTLRTYETANTSCFSASFSQNFTTKVLTIILVHSEGSSLSSETNHARNSVLNVIFVFSKYQVMSLLCHHTAKLLSASFCA